MGDFRKFRRISLLQVLLDHLLVPAKTLRTMASGMMALLAGGTMSATVADDPTISDSGRGFLVPKGGLLHFDIFVKFSKEDRFLLLSQSFCLA